MPYSTSCSNASTYCWLLEFSNAGGEERGHHRQKFLQNFFTTAACLSYLCLHFKFCLKLEVFHNHKILTFTRHRGRRGREGGNEETPLSRKGSVWILNSWAPARMCSRKTSLSVEFSSASFCSSFLRTLLYFWAVGTLFPRNSEWRYTRW